MTSVLQSFPNYHDLTIKFLKIFLNVTKLLLLMRIDTNKFVAQHAHLSHNIFQNTKFVQLRKQNIIQLTSFQLSKKYVFIMIVENILVLDHYMTRNNMLFIQFYKKEFLIFYLFSYHVFNLLRYVRESTNYKWGVTRSFKNDNINDMIMHATW